MLTNKEKDREEKKNDEEKNAKEERGGEEPTFFLLFLLISFGEHTRPYSLPFADRYH